MTNSVEGTEPVDEQVIVINNFGPMRETEMVKVPEWIWELKLSPDNLGRILQWVADEKEAVARELGAHDE